MLPPPRPPSSSSSSSSSLSSGPPPSSLPNDSKQPPRSTTHLNPTIAGEHSATAVAAATVIPTIENFAASDPASYHHHVYATTKNGLHRAKTYDEFGAHTEDAVHSYFGIFDGVNVWRKHKTVPAYYSFAHVLSAFAKDRLLTYDSTDPYRMSSALEGAVQRIVHKGYKGSCTVLLGAINNETGMLTSVSVGDSIFVVIRDNEVHFRLPAQETGFNSPLQVGHHPQASVASKHALETHLQLISGDVIVAGTDGLWDNVDDEGLFECMEEAREHEDGYCTDTLASIILERALKNTSNPHKVTPWSRAASKEYDQNLKGGKPDDVTVLVLSI